MKQWLRAIGTQRAIVGGLVVFIIVVASAVVFLRDDGPEQAATDDRTTTTATVTTRPSQDRSTTSTTSTTSADSPPSTTEAPDPNGGGPTGPVDVSSPGLATPPLPPGSPPPVRLGSISSDESAKETLTAWAAQVNAHGGLEGRPIELYIADDGGDSTANVSIAKTMVEQLGVIALVGDLSLVGGSADYLDGSGIPQVGGSVLTGDGAGHPSQFPVGPGPAGQGRALAKRVSPSASVAVLACVERPACASSADAFVAAAGSRVVYRASISGVQPTYSCGVSGNHADTVVVFADLATVGRVRQSCGEGAYYSGSLAATPADPGVLVGANGTTVVLPVFAWVGNGSLATDNYASVTASLGAGFHHSVYTVTAWTSGKLVERAVEAAAAAGHAIDAAGIRAGLASLHDETLGGLSPPLDFTVTPAPEPLCTAMMTIADGAWTAGGATPVC